MRRPALLVRDPDLVHRVLVTDFRYFVNRGSDSFINKDRKLNPLMSSHLIAAAGDEWRNLRRKMNPIFKPANLRNMDEQIADCVQKLNKLLERKWLNEGKKDVNLGSVFRGLAIDIIGSCAFGIECDSLESNTQLVKHGKNILKPSFQSMVRLLVSGFSMKLVRLLKLRDLPIETSDFYVNLVLDTMRIRRRDKIDRPDLLQLLMGLQNTYENPENAPDGSEDPSSTSINGIL
jgi:cytochrome P450 family 6